MNKLSSGMKLLLLGILLLFFLILITYELYEGFSSKQPKAISAPVRQNITCSDPEMLYMYDRFDKAKLKPPTENCDTTTTNQYDFNGKVYCLPKCKTGYTNLSNDNTLCVRTDGMCQISKDLSNTIETSWAQVCGPLYKANANLRSTIGSISSVVSTINNQFNVIDSNFPSFSNRMASYSGTNSNRQMLRDTIFNTTILSNYYDLTNFKESITSNYDMMLTKKDRFNYVYTVFNCSNY